MPLIRYRQLTIGINTRPAFRYNVRFAIFTNSHAIQQSHFFIADNVCAVKIRTVTQQSRYGNGLAGNSLLINQPHTSARVGTNATTRPRPFQLSIETFKPPSPAALSSPFFFCLCSSSYYICIFIKCLYVFCKFL